MAESGQDLELTLVGQKQARTSAKSKITQIVNWVNANVDVETNPFHFQCDSAQDQIEVLSEPGEDKEDRDRLENIYYYTVVV